LRWGKPYKKYLLPVIFAPNLTIYYENGRILPSLRSPYMKITKSKLKQLIKEELQNIMEADEDAASVKANKIANPPAEFRDTARVVKSEEEAMKLGDKGFEGTFFFFKKPEDPSGDFKYVQKKNGKYEGSSSGSAMKVWRSIQTPIPVQTSNPYIKMLGFTTNLGRAIGEAMKDGDVLVVDMREAFSETEPVDYDKLFTAAEKSKKRKIRRDDREKDLEAEKATQDSQRRRQALRYRGS